LTSVALKMEERGEVYNEKRSGPRTDPCGTPVRTGEGAEVEGLMETDWVRPMR